MDTGFYVIFAFIGAAFSMVAAVANWDWFFNHSRARLFVSVFGRQGARVAYFGLGLFLIGIGIMMMGS